MYITLYYAVALSSVFRRTSHDYACLGCWHNVCPWVTPELNLLSPVVLILLMFLDEVDFLTLIFAYRCAKKYQNCQRKNSSRIKETCMKSILLIGLGRFWYCHRSFAIVMAVTIRGCFAHYYQRKIVLSRCSQLMYPIGNVQVRWKQLLFAH